MLTKKSKRDSETNIKNNLGLTLCIRLQYHQVVSCIENPVSYIEIFLAILSICMNVGGGMKNRQSLLHDQGLTRDQAIMFTFYRRAPVKRNDGVSDKLFFKEKDW